MKVLVEAEDDRILGFTMFGVQAGEVMTATAQSRADRVGVDRVRPLKLFLEYPFYL